MLSLFVLGCASTSNEPLSPEPGVEPFQKLSLEPAYEILDLRLDFYRIEITRTQTKVTSYGGMTTTETTTTSQDNPYHPLAVHIGNGIYIDGRGNVFLSVLDGLEVDLRRDFTLKVHKTTYTKKGETISIDSIGKNEAQLTPTGMICTRNKLVTRVERQGEVIRFSSNFAVLLPDSSVCRSREAVVVDRALGKVEATIDGQGRVQLGGALTVTWEPYRMLFRHEKQLWSSFAGSLQGEKDWQAELLKTATGYEWIEKRGWLSSARRTVFTVTDGQITATSGGLFKHVDQARLLQ